MTELTEGVALGTVEEKDVECPFHDQTHKHDQAKNEFEGDATALGKALVGGSDDTSTVVRKIEPDIRYKRTLNSEADPDDRPYDQREVQLIPGDDSTWYPTGFQAHHLIPAKESLARATLLLSYIRAGKKACCTLGYNVNGNQNGVWLAGKHPVDGNGLDLWKGSSKPGPDKEGAGRKKVSRGSGSEKWSYVELKGHRPGHPKAFDKANMRWLYVQASMNSLGTRQFHDRHPTYSKNVLGHLNALAGVLERLGGSAKRKPNCGDCKKTAEGARLPPVALLGALNGLSAHYLGKVMNHIEYANFYTSSWCDPERKKIKAAAPVSNGARIARKKK
jgi:hypothetical protein